MKRRLLTLTVLLGLLLPGLSRWAHGQSIEERFQAANGAFHAQDWNAAITGYLEIQDRFGVETAALNYNLGTAYATDERPGMAIWCYERALLLAPRPPLKADILANLDAARGTLAEEYRRRTDRAQLSFESARPFWDRVFHVLNGRGLRWIFLGCLGLLITLWIGYRWGRTPRRGWAGSLVAVGFATLLAGGMVLGNHWTGTSGTLGIVVGAQAHLRDGLHERAAQHPIPEGLSVRILEGMGRRGHVRIQLSNGQEGWIALEDVKEI